MNLIMKFDIIELTFSNHFRRFFSQNLFQCNLKKTNTECRLEQTYNFHERIIMQFIHFTFNTTDFAVRTKFLASYLKKKISVTIHH